MTVPAGSVLAIVGPTASGKSATAMDVAGRIDGEIVGTDSMQAYRGMDIGTATPSRADREQVPHHMIDIWDISEPVSVVDFRDRARAAIEGVLSRGKTPIVVGGSGLYVRAVLEEMDFPGTDPRVRARFERRLAEVGAPTLHAELARVDPDAAREIEVNNGRRIVRALEVIELTGEPFTARLPDPVDRYPTVRVGLAIDRNVLDARIEQRVDAMWAAGFVAEVRALATVGLANAPTAAAALGYRPILDYLAGTIDEEQARQQTIDDTRRFARRQQRWFARDERIEWMGFDDPALEAGILAALAGDPSLSGRPPRDRQ